MVLIACASCARSDGCWLGRAQPAHTTSSRANSLCTLRNLALPFRFRIRIRTRDAAPPSPGSHLMASRRSGSLEPPFSRFFGVLLAREHGRGLSACLPPLLLSCPVPEKNRTPSPISHLALPTPALSPIGPYSKSSPSAIDALFPPYKCPWCARMCALSTLLLRHASSIHILSPFAQSPPCLLTDPPPPLPKKAFLPAAPPPSTIQSLPRPTRS